jgi:hypothetical protein
LAVLAPLALRRQQRLILTKVGSNQPADGGPAGAASPSLAVGVEFRQASALAALAQPIHRPHPGVLVWVLATAAVGAS